MTVQTMHLAHLDPTLGDEYAAYLEQVNTGYLLTWGRPMWPGDPVFPDWEAPEPTPLSPAKMEAMVVDELLSNDTDPALVYAYTHSGVMVTNENRAHVAADLAAEFDQAVDRYRRLHG